MDLIILLVMFIYVVFFIICLYYLCLPCFMVNKASCISISYVDWLRSAERVWQTVMLSACAK